MNQQYRTQLIIAAVASLTLGLAPFGEPHLFGKIKWVMGGAIGMKPMDWFDLVMHGAPWLFLIFVLLKGAYLLARKNKAK
ncbi:MAG: hypothetical protein EP338_03925 [Bacteroidetes bacterium]|nr:MAG: hypothetical protein EP338_03925 [Bacteroidota bacterium]